MGGIYDEPIHILKAVELVGAGDVTIRPIGVHVFGYYHVPPHPILTALKVYHADRPLQVSANGARVANLRFQPVVAGARVTLGGVCVELACCNLSACAVSVSAGSDVIVRRCVIRYVMISP